MQRVKPNDYSNHNYMLYCKNQFYRKTVLAQKATDYRSDQNAANI